MSILRWGHLSAIVAPMKAVDFAVSRILPEDMRQSEYDLSKKGVANIMAQIASRYPEKFGEVAKKLGDLGRNAAWYQGYSTTAADTKPIIDTSRYYAQMDAELDNLRKQKLDKEEFDDQRDEIYMKYSDMLEKDTMRAALTGNNAFARAVASGARGNAAHVKAILSTPGIYTDAKGKIIPMFVRNSFSGGLRPAEVLAGTYGARTAVISTKKCLREGTLVRMADGGSLPIQNLKVGDWVVGVDKLGITTPVRVTGVFYQGLQAVWSHTLRFSNSNLIAASVECTEDHKMLMSDTAGYRAGISRFRRGKDAKPDPAAQNVRGVLPISKLGVNRRRAALTDGGSWQGGRNEPWAAFLGLMLGDGCMTGVVNMLSCADDLMIEHIKPMLSSLGLKIRKTSADPAHYGYAITTVDYHPSMNAATQKGTQGFHSIGRVPINTATETNGMRGKYSWEKELPPSIWSWDDTSIAQLMAAYFACDGSVFSTTNARGRTQVSVAMASTSRALVAGIKTILSVRFGIHCGNIDERTEGGFGNEGTGELRKHPLYIISICRVECVKKFAELLGDHVPGVKRERLERLAKGQALVQQNPYAKMSLAEKQFVGELPCWDIAVDHPDHLFLLENGLIVSNSTAKGGDVAKLISQGTSNYNITEKDCGVANGIDLPSDDDSLSGRVLSSPAGGLPAGTVIDRQALAQIRKSGKPVVVRSAMTCGAAHGLCSKCVGVQANGYFPKVGDSVGITAGHAISEPIVQGALNVKHCLIKGTLVCMADLSIKSIENVSVGDEVLGADINGNTFGVRVTDVWNQGMQDVNLYTYATPGGSIGVICTDDHPILQYTGDGVLKKLPAGTDLSTEAAVISHRSDSRPTTLKVSRLGVLPMGKAPCFDISVDHPDELFVLANGLVVKNTSGMAKGKKSFSGFDYISQFVQIPDEFKDKAAVAEASGTVEGVESAPQGGTFITVAGQKHFALPGFESLVKVGDKVEAGDQLSDGLVNPSDIVRLRGLGEGRRYYAERLGQILTDSGNPPDKRNVEILAKSAVDNYLTEDPDEDSPWQPDEMVRENEFLRGYTPPTDTADTSLDKAVGGYLQKPVLHYTVGTKLTPKMVERMRSVGVEKVSTSRSEPWFKPEMKRLRVAAHDSKDWLVSMGTSYLTSQMREALERGDETNVQENYHFGPRLAYGADVGKGGFGENVERTGKF